MVQAHSVKKDCENPSDIFRPLHIFWAVSISP